MRLLDILVSSAGLGQKVTPTMDLAREEWRRILVVYLTRTFDTPQVPRTET